MKVLVLDNEEHDWRRIYVDGDLKFENHPSHIPLPGVLSAAGVEVVHRVIPEFDLLGESIDT